ncbi:glycosyltransferase family 4 protein [Pseudanabaena sp. PCC 6802]|uniref:glycosyltransferase family 4 protein n=1 Tax=Pseudanabaena sp. PCC 6802 TaxID=118173 RepID=UPI0003485BC7|nr:glycosyltransferase [Pseudanabaena sp. PCC 6802]
MRILYDGQIYSWQAAGGINRYFANLIGRLPHDFYPSLTNCASRDVNFPNHPNLNIYFYQRFNFRPGRISLQVEKFYFRIISTWHKFDLVHPTYYESITGQGFQKFRYPVVLTVHDMIHELFSSQMDPTKACAETKKKAITAAQAIICISENTKQDLLKYYPIPEERITIIPHASEIDISLSYGDDSVPAQPYFLYVGSRASYKNFDRLLQAFANVVATFPDLQLCVVGSSFTKEEIRSIADLKLDSHLQYYSFLSDRHLAKLYRCSIAFVYPSLYEGFGIPPLEAMSCGTPVIASNTSSLPEVVADAGLLFNPLSTDELSDCLRFVLDNPANREQLVQKGFERAREFSWDKTVNQTLDVYRAVAS